MEVNDYQVGGSHYQMNYQHWDMAIDSRMPYLLAAATKYLSRWKNKNGLEDLRKAIHYLQKAQEHFIFMPRPGIVEDLICLIFEGKTKTRMIEECLTVFSNQLSYRDGRIFYFIVEGKYQVAIAHINEVIKRNTPAQDSGEPSSNYTNQG